MNRDMICGWLGLADKRWPPDPYALLGLTPTECVGGKIEQRVQERMAKLRCYQLNHPDEATEGMNRVAQAFIVLVERHCPRPEPSAAPTETVDKRATASLGKSTATKKLGDTAVTEKTRVDWRSAPPPVRSATEPPAVRSTKEPPPPLLPVNGPTTAPPPLRAAKETPLPAIPVDGPAPAAPARPADFDVPAAPVETEEQVIRSLAEESDDARAGVLTLQTVIERADLTRQLLIAWRRAGRYLASPKRKLTRSAEKKDFTEALEAIREAAEHYPDFVVHPGRPGYRAAALANLGMTPEMFHAMGEEPRELLARDWTLAHKILLAHRAFLLRHFKALRRRGMVGRVVHLLRTSLKERPMLWRTLGIAVVTLTLVLIAVLVIVPWL